MRSRLTDGNDASAPTSGGGVPVRQAPRVLVIDDDEGVNEAMCSLLSDRGYEVHAAHDGREGLGILRGSFAADVILLDLMMPVMDGWEFRATQKTEPLLASIPVIALSVDPTPQARAIDAAEFLAKPVGSTALISAIERVCSRSLAARMANAERMAALGALAAGVAHEINNPLTYMLENLQSLVRRLKSDDVRPTVEVTEMLQDTLHGAQRIARIVRSVQSVTPQRSIDRQVPVDVEAALEASLRVVANELRHRARVGTTFQQLPPVRAFPGQLEQVFINLLLNAAHAIDEGNAEGNSIEVTTAVASESVIVRVTDTGSGIAGPIRGRIFEPFFTTKEQGTGTGLGLSICHGIVKSLGGAISFTSQLGAGSTFEVTLPAIVGAEQSSPANDPPISVATRRVHVLAVDDDEPVLRAICRMLAPDHDVVVASTGLAALELLERSANLDVVLCDLAMPQMSGLELLAVLQGRRPDLARRTIFMTGGAFTPSARALTDSGRHLVLPKPLSRDALLTALQRTAHRTSH